MSDTINMLKKDLENHNFKMEKKYTSDTIITYDIIDLNEGHYICELIYQPNNIIPFNYRLYYNVLDYYYSKPFECIKRLLDAISFYM